MRIICWVPVIILPAVNNMALPGKQSACLWNMPPAAWKKKSRFTECNMRQTTSKFPWIFFLQKDWGTLFSGDVHHHHLWYLLVLLYCCWVPHCCGIWFFKNMMDKNSSVNTCCFAMQHGRRDHALWLLMLQPGKPGAVKPENWAPETAGVIWERSVESARGSMSSLVRC